MTSVHECHRSWTLGIAIGLAAIAIAGDARAKFQIGTSAQTPSPSVEPSEATKARLQSIVKGIVSMWDKFDVVCLGEGHGSKDDSNLRIALIEHPDFVRKVNVIIVEWADTAHQDLLDRLALEGEDIPREKLRAVWQDSPSAKQLWELPIYEAFLRAVRKVNLTVPRDRRVRLIAGDNSTEQNRGAFIRDAVSREILDKGLKALAIYGKGHCQCRGMGFPGELASKYPGKIWSAFTFNSVEEGRRVLNLGDEPRLIPITGTEQAKIPAVKMFDFGRINDTATLGNITNAIVYFGNAREVVNP